jgi:hypothetical protein
MPTIYLPRDDDGTGTTGIDSDTMSDGDRSKLEELVRETPSQGMRRLEYTNPLMAVAMSELVESLLALGIQEKLYALTRSTGSFLPTLSLHWVKRMAMAGIPSSTTWADLFPSPA